VTQQLAPALGSNRARGLAVTREESVRMPPCLVDEAVATLSGIDHQHVAAGPGELQRCGQAREAAADDREINLHGCDPRAGAEPGDAPSCVDGSRWRERPASRHPVAAAADARRLALPRSMRR